VTRSEHRPECGGSGLQWLDDIAAWDGTVPAAITALDLSRVAQRDLLRLMAARVLGRPVAEVTILHREGRAPRIAAPCGTQPGSPDLGLSLASRGRFSAFAVAAGRVGIDVEIVDPAAEVPWAVLHPRERADLAARAGLERASAFARLWTLKEAYLKACHWGLARDPAAFQVRVLDETRAHIDNPGEENPPGEATTIWRHAGGQVAAISVVLLADRPLPIR
jgi:phosphopantetheinyl transferase